MRYRVLTDLSPEDVLQRAKLYFGEHTRMGLAEESADSVRFRGEIGSARIRAERAHGYTVVEAETDRPVGLDVTDVTKRFLYTLGHV